MHEIKIAEDLKHIILEVAGRNNLKKISTVNIQFGEMVQINSDIFHFAFEEVSKNSLIEGATLYIEILPLVIRCKHCLTQIEIPRKGSFRCSNCKSTNIEIIQGRETIIKSIEGE